MGKIKVVLIGAGSATFGQGTIVDLISSKKLRERELKIVLVDINGDALDRMLRLSSILKNHYKSEATIEATLDREEALTGANYVITSVAKRRWELWEKDYYIPAAYGFKHVFGENGGPGGAFHTLRSLNIMMPICKDMEKLCPDALLINFTNPESRVCLGISKLTKIRSVGLCHGPIDTLNKISEILEMPKDEIDLTVGGLNHFHWVLKVTSKKTGENLYPKIDEKIDSYDWDVDALTPILYKVFGLLPFPAPSHVGEYINFAHEINPAVFVDWGLGEVSRKFSSKATDLDYVIEGRSKRPSYDLWSSNQVERIDKILTGELPITSKDLMLHKDVTEKTRELAIPIICDIEFNLNRRELAGNVMNKGFAISNLPEDAIVEIPIIVNSDGIKPVKVGPLPTAIAGMCSIQIYIQELLIEAYEKKSKKALFQAISIDPIIDNLDRAKKMMEKMLKIEADYLPEIY
ncbi:Alpha-glucosidase [subsurface metagenome]|nr:hypothetical protein [Clostridia bacterium]